MAKRPQFATIDDYIASAAEPVKPLLQKIRRVVNEAIPNAQETISYKMPAFKVTRTFFYFAAFKTHIGVYPPVTDDQTLIELLHPYRGPKGNLSFPLDQPIPYALVAQVAVALYRQYEEK